MKRSNRNYRTVFLWVLSLVVVLSMVFGFVASLSYARPTATPTPTYALPTFTPTATPASQATTPQATTPEPPKANPPAPSPTAAG